ncbi:protein of unknown function [Streptococcus thermophilus]|nr:protein of unknown function [Streptococcus thermophilus]
MIKYDFQKPSKIPLLEQAGTPTLLRLKKRRFQCKNCRRVTVVETSIVEKKLPNLQSSPTKSYTTPN